MATIGLRALGALLALVGLALTVVGVWFATQLGTSGTAELSVHPATSDPVLIGPDVLNRVDTDVVVTATPTDGGSVWMALANPSDATAVVGGSQHLAVTGVSVRDWTLLTTTAGTASAPELGAADLWRQQDDARGPVTLTVQQSQAPETLVVKAQSGQLSSLTIKVTDKSWFVEAVVGALIGLFLLVAGVVLLTARGHRHRHHGVAVPPVPAAPGTPGPDETVGAGDGAVASPPFAPGATDPHDAHDAHDALDHHDPEEVTR
jgi:hypothetical protein